MFTEQQENIKHMDEEFKMKEDRINKSLNLLKQSLNLIEEREQGWQEEKAEILKEVQRLKAVGTHMVKILASEHDEDDLSEDKMRRLGQEIYSLQLVVEMRTGEARSLRELLARATQQLEQAEIVKDKMRKATVRMEDLEEQIKIKHKIERYILFPSKHR